MARSAIRGKDDPTHQQRAAKEAKKHKRRKQKKDLGQAVFEGKKFSELNGNEKDDLLQAIALQLDLVEPEDD